VIPRSVVDSARIHVRLWPARGLETQTLRLLVNGHSLGARTLLHSPQTVSFDVPARYWLQGRNLLVLQFREVVDPSDARSLPRAAGVDWIEITPAASGGAAAATTAPPPPIQDAGQR